MAAAHDVEVDEVYRRPGSEQVQQERQQILEAVDEVAGRAERDEVAHHERHRETRQALAYRAAQLPHRVSAAQQRQGGAVEVQGRYGDQAEQRPHQQHLAQAGKHQVCGVLHGGGDIERRRRGRGDRADQHHPGATDESPEVGPPE